ncbi:MAG: TonB-dependent receptor [Acidobacteriaceae bacterium]
MREHNVGSGPRGRTVGVKYLWLSSVLLLLFGMFSAMQPAHAQAVYGSIFGTVTDNTGAVIPNATITVTDTAKGTQVTVQTGVGGDYRVQHLIPDTYRVDAGANGFSTSSADNILIYADTSPKVDLKLSIGSTSNTVTVSSATPLLQTDRAEVSTILNERAVENLPNFNRNFTAFELLTPGTSFIGWDVGEANNPQRSQQIEVNGQLPFSTGYELDGTDNQDPIIGVAVISPNLDAISEEKVTSQNYDAEFGKAVAGLVTAQTRSGSNSLHGSAFEYRRSDAQQARDPFTEFAPDPISGRYLSPNLHNQFGGSVGGPIRKDKLFFFADYQGLREKTGTALLTTVPTALARSSCLSGNGCDFSEYIQGGQGQIFDPTTNQTALTGRTPFANNFIPADRLSAPSINFLKLLPNPNVAGAGIVNNYLASGSGLFSNDQLDGRVDSQLTDRLHIFGRYTYFQSSLSGAPYFGAAGGGGFGSGGFAGTDAARDQSVAAGLDKVVSPRWLTDARFGYFRIHLDENGPDFNQALGNQLGIPNANVGNLALNGGLPQFNIDNASNGTNGGGNLEYGTSAAQFSQDSSQYQFVNNWSHLKGNHNIRFGVDLRYALNHLVGLDNNNVRSGNFHFTQTRTAGVLDPVTGSTSSGLGFATFLLGDVTSFQRTQTQNTDAQERQKRLFFYGQDQWRITNKLTLNYGLRWEQILPESVTGRGQGGLLDLDTGDIRIAGYGPYGSNLNVQKNWLNLGPRVGIAYQANPNTVVRSGYGRVYGQGWSGNTFGEVLTFSFPTQVSQNLNPVSNAAALFNLTQGPPGFTFAPIPADGNYPLPDGVGVPLRPLKVRLNTLDAWNLAVQQQLNSTLSLQIGYVGSHGIHNQFDSSNQASPNTQTIAGFNQINPETGKIYTQSERRPYFDGTAQRELGLNFGHAFGWEQDLRYNANQATSSYEALQVVADKRFSQGLQFISHYTFSRAQAHESYYYFIDPRVGYGPSYYNRRNAFVFASNYDLPFGKGKLIGGNVKGWVDEIIGGFTLNGSVTIQSGLPYTPAYALSSSDNDIVGFLNRANPTAGFNLHSGSLNPLTHKVQYFTPSPYVLQPSGPQNSFGPYARPAAGTFGNLGRDTLTSPGLWNSDLAIAKNFNLTERIHFQLRAEAYNAFNHVNLGGPDSCVDCQDGNAGTVSSSLATQDGTSLRRLQFSGRFSF